MTDIHHKGLISFLTISITVAALYAFTGNIGLIFASGSQYSTAIWIPSGIALGSVLVYGLRSLPGIFIGSLIINYQITALAGSSLFEFQPLLVGSIIAAGATLQAYIGWLLVSKWIGLHNQLNEPNSILLFALLSGPVSCIMNATTSNLSLVALNILPLRHFIESWVTWYVGDSIGVLIFTPIFLIIFAKPHDIWHSRIIPILIPLAMCFLIVSASYMLVKTDERLVNQLWFALISGLMFCVLVNITLFIIQGQKNLMQLRMREILRSAGEVIIGVDINENIIFANPAAELMWGKIESEILEKQIHEFINNENNLSSMHNSECPIHSAIKNNKKSHVTNKLLLLNGCNSIWVEYTCTPLVISDKTTGAVIVLNDITKRRESESHLERLAHYDILTNLPNRSSFNDALNSAIKNANEKTKNLSVCFVDLDNFKFVNDNLGHSNGDIALRDIAKLIAENIDKGDYIARLGGDEFGLIIYNKESLVEINLFMDKLTSLIGRPIYIDQSVINISLSIGIATYPIAGKTADELIKNADIAMYRAKESGKNTYAFYNDELCKATSRIHQIESELQNALSGNEISIVYQPQVEIVNQKIVGLEVLIRWYNPKLGQVSPAEFIPIAERNGMIHPIGEWVLKQVAMDYRDTISKYSNDVTISVNVSVIQLSDTRFYNNIISVLETAKLNNRLILEITETAFMANPKETIDIMKEINMLGVYFSLDDFGINYSSMRYLKSLPIAQLKIDYIFIKDIDHDKNDLAIVNTIIQLANDLGLPTVAEGVETRAQLDLLVDMGCSNIQGFYFYKPMTLTELIKGVTFS